MYMCMMRVCRYTYNYTYTPTTLPSIYTRLSFITKLLKKCEWE